MLRGKVTLLHPLISVVYSPCVFLLCVFLLCDFCAILLF